MRNLLFQFKRAIGHMKSILGKLISKMTKGATLSIQTLVNAVLVLFVLPIATIVLGAVVLMLIASSALGGEQIPIDSVSRLYNKIPAEVI